MKAEQSEFFSNFEKSLQELNSIVDEMERGDLALERAMTLFERAMKLLHECHKTIEKAEQKVQILVVKNDFSKLERYQES
jgi:exodeoxyribonuclease VII small subunit